MINTQYVEDTVISAVILKALVNKSVKSKQSIKNKIFAINKNNSGQSIVSIYLNCKEYKYLDTTKNKNKDDSQEIRIRIEQARNTIRKAKKFFCYRNLKLYLKKTTDEMSYTVCTILWDGY